MCVKGVSYIINSNTHNKPQVGSGQGEEEGGEGCFEGEGVLRVIQFYNVEDQLLTCVEILLCITVDLRV